MAEKLKLGFSDEGASKFDAAVIRSLDSVETWQFESWRQWRAGGTKPARRFDVAEKLKLGFRDEGASKFDAAVFRSLDLSHNRHLRFRRSYESDPRQQARSFDAIDNVDAGFRHSRAATSFAALLSMLSPFVDSEITWTT